MTQDDYLARIDQRLENLVSQIQSLLEHLYADSTAVKAAIFGLGDYLQESNDRMERIESSIEKSNDRMERIESSIEKSNDRMARIESSIEKSNDRMARIEFSIEKSNERMDKIDNTIAHQTAIADKQADSVRQLIEMLNRKQA